MMPPPFQPKFLRSQSAPPAADGIVRCLAPERADAFQRFLAQYRQVRAHDGYRRASAAYYRRLPVTSADDPQHAVWEIRRRSFDRFRAMLRGRFQDGAPVVLDLGAGNGWLSHRLSLDGFRAVAVDISDDAEDGLGACRHYETPFVRVQADFDDLPFLPRQFDVIVFNGSLHYAPRVRTTLTRVAPLIASGGVLAVIDSPFFECPDAGQQMRHRMADRWRREYGVPDPMHPGEGFLLFSRLAETARALGLDAHFFESRGGLGWSLSRLGRRVRDGVTPASFGVWWAA